MGGRRPDGLIDGIRAATVADAGAIADVYAPYVRETAISFELDPPGATEMAARIAKVLPAHPWLVAENEGRGIGYAYGSRHAERAAYRWSATVGIYLAREAHGRGVGRALYAVLLAALKLQGYHAVFGGITLPNAASVGLHEASGFKPVGVYREAGYKFGRWHDVGWWGLRFPIDGAPEEPLPATPLLLDEAKAIAGGNG
jgi:phosphinothricin acetyltransferase